MTKSWFLITNGIVLELEGNQRDSSNSDEWYFKVLGEYMHIDDLFEDRKAAVLAAIEECHKQIRHYSSQLNQYAVFGLTGNYDA